MPDGPCPDELRTAETPGGRRLCARLAVAALAAAPAVAAEPTVEVALLSAYVWRGMAVSDRAVLQPSLSVEHGRFSSGLWANVGLTETNGVAHEVSEVDAWAAVTVPLRGCGFTFSAYGYTYPHSDAASTVELWATAAFDAFLNPSVTVVRDVAEVEGWYVQLAASLPVGILAGGGSDGLLVGLAIGRGDSAYRSAYFPDAGGGHVTDIGLRFDLPLTFASGTLTLSVQLTGFVESAVRLSEPGAHDPRISGGLTYSFAF